MTSRPSLPPPSSGSRARARRWAPALALAAAFAAGRGGGAGWPGPVPARADDASPLRERRPGGVEIDWAEGTLTASGGAAADLRMPSADVARPGAVRRARAAALARLRAALGELPLGGGRALPADAVERALARARPGAIDYQSNGGAVVRASVRFADWLDGGGAPDVGAPEPAVTLRLAAARLQAAPPVKVGGRDGTAGAAVYRLGAPPAAAGALPARADKGGRLSFEGDAALLAKVARGVVVIYVEKVTR